MRLTLMIFHVATFLSVLELSWTDPFKPSSSKPHIIFIVADDLVSPLAFAVCFYYRKHETVPATSH